ncbi:DgyrCDS3474 [Dimorphilus gyrociliatus]|uniref:Nucleolar protein 6 n=1 Tax=Dimorphilus gyrociliatus TaxID=2664684 RepID=A0A7I8VGE3_9ANNE|nr:DgyrCDS3474 [Dimorphilus gyrociliatus]
MQKKTFFTCNFLFSLNHYICFLSNFYKFSYSDEHKKEDETATLKMLSVITATSTGAEETNDLSSIQLSEIFSECFISTKKQKKIDEWLKKLKIYLKNLNSDQSIDVELPTFLPEDVEKFHLKSSHAPENIEQVSPYWLNSDVTSKTLNIEVCLEIPKNCVFPKDTINYKYFCKRMEYLAKVASFLKNSDLVADIFWSLDNSVTYRPILIIEPNELKNVKVFVKTVVHKDVLWKSSRFQPGAINVKPEYFKKSEVEQSTSFYNDNLGLEKFYFESRRQLQEKLKPSDTATKGCILLKIWLRNRFLNTGFGNFNDHIAECFSVFVLEKEETFLSPLHFFKIAMKHINEDFFLKPKALNGEVDEEYKKYYDVIFLDGFSINLCSHWHKNTVDRIKYEAKIALSLIDASQGYQSNLIENLFAYEIQPEFVFDQVIYIKKCKPIESEISTCCNIFSAVPKIIQILERAIGRRVKNIIPYSSPTQPWNILSKREENTLAIGLILNLQHSYEILEKGPSADSNEAKSFRNFWGEKSEMRKFQDTSICEAVVFPADNAAKKRKIITKMIKYILERHLNVVNNDLKILSNSIDSQLTEEEKGTGEEELASVCSSFDNLCKILRKLSQDLPLPIQAIHGLHPILRMTSTSSTPEIIDIICLLETSGKWPEDINAIKRLKVAYLLELRKKLKLSNYQVELSIDFLDVTFNNLKFRISVAQTGEITMLKMNKSNKGLIKFTDTEESIEAQKLMVAKPLFASMIKGLQQEYPVFSLSVRLVKKWLDSQMLSPYFEDEAIELLVAYIFRRKSCYNAPNCSRVTFLRFLELIASFDWKMSGLIINIDDSLSNSSMEEIRKEIVKSKKTLPSMVLSWSGDKKGCMFTKSTPDFIIRHLVVLSKKSMELLSSSPTNVEILFKPDLSIFDILIHVKKSVGKEIVEKFVNRINLAYKSNAIFFFDKSENLKIGGIWKPNAKNRSFSTTHCHYASPNWNREGEIILTIDSEVVKEDIRILGKDVINSIAIVRPMV